MSRKKQGKDGSSTPYSINTRTAKKANSQIPEMQFSDNDSDEDSYLENLDPSQTLMVGILKKMMDKLEINITSKLDKTVNEIKEDVSQIKIHLEKYDDKFEEVQNKIGDCDDRIDKMGEVIEEIYDFKTEWEKNLTEINKDACRIRKDNIIFLGIQGGSKDMDVARANFDRVCRENLKMSEKWIQEVDIKEIYHFTAKGGEGPMPLFVRLGKSRHKEDLFKAAFNLKGSNIVMRNDLAPWLLKFRKKLSIEAAKLKKEPHNYETKLRDTSFKVWLEIKKPNSTKWETWDGKSV